jgi:hypothetical protein
MLCSAAEDGAPSKNAATVIKIMDAPKTLARWGDDAPEAVAELGAPLMMPAAAAQAAPAAKRRAFIVLSFSLFGHERPRMPVQKGPASCRTWGGDDDFAPYSGFNFW